jgi:hypothetical protein
MLNIILMASPGGVLSIFSYIPGLIIIGAIILVAIKIAMYEEDLYISDLQTNKVIHVRLVGGIIGLFFVSPQSALNNRIRNENAKGWNVVQVIPAESGNIFLAIFRILILILTLFLYTPVNGFYVIMEREKPTGNFNRIFSSSENKKYEAPKNLSQKEISQYESNSRQNTINYTSLSDQEKKITDYFIKCGLKNGERLVINKINRKIEKFDEKEWENMVRDFQQNDWIIIS